jgi:hypothetical protein
MIKSAVNDEQAANEAITELKRRIESARKQLTTLSSVLLIAWTFSLSSCSPVVLTSAWNDPNVQPAGFSRILVVSFANDTSKRRFGENHIKAALGRYRLVAFTSLEVFGPGFTTTDSAKRQELLLANKFDGLITFRVLGVHEEYQLQLSSLFSGSPNRNVVEQDVQMGSEFYRVKDDKVMWWGRSVSSSTDPTEQMAKQYARNIVRDMIKKRVLLESRQH